MPTTPNPTPSSPSRVPAEYTVGRGFYLPPTSTTAVAAAPNVVAGGGNDQPRVPIFLGVDSATATAAVPALADGVTSANIVFSMSLSKLPPGISLNPPDKLQIFPMVSISHTIAGLAIASFNVLGQGILTTGVGAGIIIPAGSGGTPGFFSASSGSAGGNAAQLGTSQQSIHGSGIVVTVQFVATKATLSGTATCNAFALLLKVPG